MNIKDLPTRDVMTEMKKRFGHTNNLAAPRLNKVIVNVGLGKNLRDDKFREMLNKAVAIITGQKPIPTFAKHSIAGFGIREGQMIGAKVTLRKQKMFDFIDRIIHITLPRVRDFQGLNPASLDKKGNLTIGFKDWMVFPEINPEEITITHGLEVTFVSTAKKRDEALAFFTLLKFPFRKA